MKPLIIINFKNYREATGVQAVTLARQVSNVRSARYSVALAPSLLDVAVIAKKTRLPVFAQHADPVPKGAYTGKIPPALLHELGVKGVLLSHSERRLPFTIIKNTLRECRRLKMITVVCAATVQRIKELAPLHPDYIAYEPQKLIGGNISVSTAKPKIIKKALKVLGKRSSHTRLLVGAGVHSGEDLRRALELGASGVLIGHAVPKARNPRLFLEKMLE